MAFVRLNKRHVMLCYFYACETLLTMFAVDFKTVTIITMSITATGIGRNALLTTCLSVCEEDNSKRCGMWVDFLGQ